MMRILGIDYGDARVRHSYNGRIRGDMPRLRNDIS